MSKDIPMETKIELKSLEEQREKIEPKIKKIQDGVYHDGEKMLYETAPDEQWDCLCMRCDKELLEHLTKVLISGSVLSFCMLMLWTQNGDSAFYSSTISLILGTFLGTQMTQSKNPS